MLAQGGSSEAISYPFLVQHVILSIEGRGPRQGVEG
jgi:hypothetical protein